MKKILYLFPILALMMLVTVACSSDDRDIETPVHETEYSYEITSDVQYPLSLFLGGFPEEYAAFKEPLEMAFTMREDA